MKHKLPKLPYTYNSLEPYIDARTIKIHHDKHHQGYVNKLNKALESYPKLQKKKAEDLIRNLNKIPGKIRIAVRNNGGGHVNHTFFWNILKKNAKFEGKIAKEIQRQFGSYDKFKEKFSAKAAGLFGSGWTWLVLDNKKLKMINTQGHDNPISKNMKPLLVIDVWEHAYYLKYQNRRKDYIDSFFNIINWKQVDKNYGG